jgi:hypothetical protein
VLLELNTIKKEREAKAVRLEKRSKRKPLPKGNWINSEIYNLLIKESEGPSYIVTRTRIVVCLLTVRGIWIGELLPLKVGQLETLIKGRFDLNRSIEKESFKSQSLFNFRSKKTSKVWKKRFRIFIINKG